MDDLALSMEVIQTMQHLSNNALNTGHRQTLVVGFDDPLEELVAQDL